MTDAVTNQAIESGDEKETELKLKFAWDESRIPKIPARGKVAIQRIMRKRVADLEGMIAVLAVFMLGEDGEYLPRSEAEDILMDMDDESLNQTFTLFWQAVQSAAVPKANGKGSKHG